MDSHCLLAHFRGHEMVSITGPYQALCSEISSGNSPFFFFFSVKVFFFFETQYL